jgi:oligopeptide/dipeptide ABC transporter ATP-binding protein
MPAPLLEVEHLQAYFPDPRRRDDGTGGLVLAVDDVSLRLREGETLGIVGEAGAGKTTLARCIVRLLEPTGGVLWFAGRDITTAGPRALRAVRDEMQIVLPDSLNPRQRVGQLLGMPLRLRGWPRRGTGPRSRELLAMVGVHPEYADRFPHQLSAGQCRRVALARALAPEPRLIVLDEPAAGLDDAARAQVVDLVAHLRDPLGLSYIVLTRDPSVVERLADEIAVLHRGKVVELASAEELQRKPIHPHTQELLSRRGVTPASATDPRACRFHTRCPRATGLCATAEPPLAEYAGGHLAACHHPVNVTPAEIREATRSPLSPLSAADLRPPAARG